jgi:hypothetical protein
MYERYNTNETRILIIQINSCDECIYLKQYYDNCHYDCTQDKNNIFRVDDFYHIHPDCKLAKTNDIIKKL